MNQPKHCLFACLLLLCMTGSAHAENAYRRAGDLFDSKCAERRIPLAEAFYVDSTGTQVSLWHGDPGLAEGEVAIWPLGSITKCFTAVLALELQEAGTLDLDAPLANYIPEIDDMFSEAELGNVTLRTLMSHRSGLPYHLAREEHYAFVLPAARLLLGEQPKLSHEMLLASVSTRPLQFEPGQGYQYSNANFWLAALAMERATGRDYDWLLPEHVLGPLELAQTTLWEEPWGCRRMPAHYIVNGEVLDISGWDMPGMGRSAGGLYASSQDLWYFSELLREGSLLDETQFAELTDFIDTGQTANGEAYSYGLGISKRFDGQRWMYGHNGTTPGNRALWRFDPETGETLIIFSSLGSQGLNGIGDELTAVLRGE
ncbi:MAG: serine hydrolase domain-containing protein [bacterium]